MPTSNKLKRSLAKPLAKIKAILKKLLFILFLVPIAAFGQYTSDSLLMTNHEFAQNNIHKVIISDITGKRIMEETEVNQNVQIDLSNFDTGIYLIGILTEYELFNLKILKE